MSTATETPRIAAALPTRRQCERGAETIHAARVKDIPLPEHAGGGSMPYTERTTLCGEPSWGVAAGMDADKPRLDLVNCGRCKTTRTWRMANPDVRRLTKDNVRELFGWIESGKPHYAPGMVVDGLSVYGTRGREVALFGDFIVRDCEGFHVRKNERVTV